MESGVSEHSAQGQQTDTTPQSAESEHRKKNREPSAAARVPNAARAFDEELFVRNPSKALKVLRSGGRAATAAAGGKEELVSSAGRAYGAYRDHKAQQSQSRRWVADEEEIEARDLEDEMLEARGLIDAWKALWKPQSKEEKAKKLQKDARIAADKAEAATAALDERDFFEMEDDLTARDFAYEMDELD